MPGIDQDQLNGIGAQGHLYLRRQLSMPYLEDSDKTSNVPTPTGAMTYSTD